MTKTLAGYHELQIETLNGDWAGVSLGSEENLIRDADTLWEVLGQCARVVEGSKVVYSRLDPEHEPGPWDDETSPDSGWSDG